MSAHTAETVSQSVSILTLSARIAESGSITHLPETIRPVSWAVHYAGAEQPWERAAEARVNQEVAPLLAEIATAEPPADVAHLYASVDSWRRAAVAETRRTASKEAYERVVGEMRREALAAIHAKGAAFQPVEWEESTRIFLVQGEWTVTVSVSGTDHAVVREAFAAGLPGRCDEILADAQKRIPRVSGTVRAAAWSPVVVRSGLSARPLMPWSQRSKGSVPNGRRANSTSWRPSPTARPEPPLRPLTCTAPWPSGLNETPAAGAWTGLEGGEEGAGASGAGVHWVTVAAPCLGTSIRSRASRRWADWRAESHGRWGR